MILSPTKGIRETTSVYRTLVTILVCALFLMSTNALAQVVLTEPEPEPEPESEFLVPVLGEPVGTPEPVGLTPQFLDPETTDQLDETELPTDIQADDDWSSTVPPAATSLNTVGEGSGVIEINRLTAVTSDSVGTLSFEEGGMPLNLWHGTRFQTAATLFSNLPTATTSPALRRMMRRLLVSEAQPPADLPMEGEFIARRLETLSAMGETRASSELLAITPGRNSSDRLVKIESEVSLTEGRFIEACTQAGNVVREGAEGYWQKVLIFCQVLAGSRAEAELGIALMREVGVDDETLLLMLDSMIRSETPVLNTLSDQSPLHMAVLRASNARLGPDAVEVPSPPILAAIASNQDMDMPTRLEAAELAAASGALQVGDHRKLFLSVPFTLDEIESPISTAEGLPGTMARALLYQAAKSISVHSARAEAAALALATARRDNVYASTANVFLDVIVGVPPRSDLVWFAGDAVRAFVLTGNANAAIGWMQMLRGNASRQADAREALIALVPVVRLAGLADTEDPTHQTVGLAEWLELISTEPERRTKATLLFSMLDSLGEPVGIEAWESLGLMDEVEQPEIDWVLPDFALWHRLTGAANGGRLGETILLAALVLGDAGPGGVDGITMGHVVRNLSTIGMHGEARAMAIEAAIASGL